jgi:hypothetical protein
MSDHFIPGDYAIWQGNKNVGRIVAVDSPYIAEHWFLYFDVPDGATGYATYTAPSPSNAHATKGTFAYAQDVEWTFEDMGSPTGFDPTDYLSKRKAELPAEAGVRYVMATPCAATALLPEQKPRPKPKDPGDDPQVAWGEYVLQQQLGATLQLVGMLIVPISSTEERWGFSSSASGDYESFSPPVKATMTGTRTTYRLVSRAIWRPWPAAPSVAKDFCVRCSVTV